MARGRHTADLLRESNVIGVGVGYKEKGGQKTDTPNLVVMIRKKIPLSKLKARDAVPPEIDGVTTDVREVGEIKTL